MEASQGLSGDRYLSVAVYVSGHTTRSGAYNYMYKIAAAAWRRLPAFIRRIFELLLCELAMRITPRPETPSSCSPTSTVSEEASSVLAPCPGCRLAGCAVLVFLQKYFKYVICEFDQLSGRY